MIEYDPEDPTEFDPETHVRILDQHGMHARIACPWPDGSRVDVTGFVLETWWLNSTGYRRTSESKGARQFARLAVHVGSGRWFELDTVVPLDLRPARRGQTLRFVATVLHPLEEGRPASASRPMSRAKMREREARRALRFRDDGLPDDVDPRA